MGYVFNPVLSLIFFIAILNSFKTCIISLIGILPKILIFEVVIFTMNQLACVHTSLLEYLYHTIIT